MWIFEFSRGVCSTELRSTCAYIEWLVNELMLIANKIEYKDVRLVMFPADAINP